MNQDQVIEQMAEQYDEIGRALDELHTKRAAAGRKFTEAEVEAMEAPFVARRRELVADYKMMMNE